MPLCVLYIQDAHDADDGDHDLDQFAVSQAGSEQSAQVYFDPLCLFETLIVFLFIYALLFTEDLTTRLLLWHHSSIKTM